MLVRQLIGEVDSGPSIPGTWACRDAANSPTDCQTGKVRVARFLPTDALAARREYTMTLNLEFSLDVTDLAGNPFQGDDAFFSTTRPG